MGWSAAPLSPRSCTGMTLVELMVAMAIGLFLMGGALYVYSQGRNTYRASDSLARLQEHARFALDTIEPDIRLARYWGRHAEPGLLQTPAGIQVRCTGTGTDVTAFALSLTRPVEARDDGYDLGCPAFADEPQAGSDVLILRHADPWSGGPAAPEPGRLQVQSNLNGGRLFDDGNVPDLGPGAATWNVIINAYYVSRRSSFEGARSSLRRLTLRKGAVLGDEEVIPGVENLQVQLGMDTNGDGNVDRYVDGDHPLVTEGGPAFDPDARPVAVRVWMLVSGPADDPAWVDNEAYVTPDADLGPLVGGTDGYPAGSRRLQISRTIFLGNQGA